MSAFNNNNSNLNNTSAGIEGRASNNIETAYQRAQGTQSADFNTGNNLSSTYDRDQTRQSGTNNLSDTYSRPIDNTNAANNIETAYQGDQTTQSADYKHGNNLNDTYNRYQPGQAGAGDTIGELNENHGIAASGLNGNYGVTAAGVGSHNVTGSGLNANHGVTGTGSNYNNNNTHHTSELNENHGLAATGLNEPHTHSTVGRNNENLDFSGPQTDVNKVDQQQENYGHTAGKDLNSQTNRTAGTGIPPVNTAEHVRRNRAEEEVDGNHTHSNHHKSNTAALGDHGASHHDKNNGGVSQHDRSQAEKERKAAGINEPLNNEADNKPSMGDKIKGNLEKAVGKLSGNEEKVIKGENLAQGRSI